MDYDILFIIFAFFIAFTTSFIFYVKNKYIWVQVSRDEVIYAWLKAEYHNKTHKFCKEYKYAKTLITKDLNLDVFRNDDCYQVTKNSKTKAFYLKEKKLENDEEIINRRIIFNCVRGQYNLWKPICKNTKWYKTLLLLNSPFTYIFCTF